jgi:dipeptidyl aminopeptidase/acylaminoacyl peptidase
VPGQVPGASPVLITHGDADRNIPVDQSEALRRRLCAAGTPVERRVLPGLDHVAGAVPTIDDGATWLAERLSGAGPIPPC